MFSLASANRALLYINYTILQIDLLHITSRWHNHAHVGPLPPSLGAKKMPGRINGRAGNYIDILNLVQLLLSCICCSERAGDHISSAMSAEIIHIKGDRCSVGILELL